MGGQIVDATVVAAPKQRNTEADKAALKAGRVPDAWKAKPAEDGSKRIDVAVLAFGYKNHVGIDRSHGLIRTWTTTDAARHDGLSYPVSS
jgi:hypothetical protein